MTNQQVTTERSQRSEPARSFLQHPLTSLQSEIDRVFGEFMQNFDTTKFPFLNGSLLPKADFSESETAYELAVEVPGVAEKDMEVSVKNGVLTVKGDKKSEKEDKKKDYLRTERSCGSYYRAMTLPDDADEPKITARYTDGVLRIAIPKLADSQAKSQKIAIQKS